MPNFAKHPEKYAKPKIVRELNDDFFISLTEEIYGGLKTPSISRKEILNAIESGNISPDVVDDLEDALLWSIMQENINDSGFVSEDEIMEALR